MCEYAPVSRILYPAPLLQKVVRDGSHLSGLDVAIGIERHFTTRCGDTALHLGKDLAVSLPMLPSGLPAPVLQTQVRDEIPFGLSRLCSHLYPPHVDDGRYPLPSYEIRSF
jgi:hypothetical protein